MSEKGFKLETDLLPHIRIVKNGDAERERRALNRRKVEVAALRIYLVDYQEKLNDLVHELGLRHLIK